MKRWHDSRLLWKGVGHGKEKELCEIRRKAWASSVSPELVFGARPARDEGASVFGARERDRFHLQAVTSVASAAKRYKQLYSTRNGGRWSLTLE